MPTLCPITPYKGLFVVVLIFVLLEYFFNTIADSKSGLFFNTTKLANHGKDSQAYGPLLKTLFFKNNKTNNYNITTFNSTTIKTTNYTYFKYIVTEPSFFTNTSNNLTNPLDLSSTTESENNSLTRILNTTALPLCPDDVSSNLLGRVPLLKYPVPTVQELERTFSWLKPGGHWQPESCRVMKKVAIVIPFRCRGKHLLLFLRHMHPILKRQQLDYTIFIVEQDANAIFNRAILMNIGFKEAMKVRNFDCFIFHDIDLLPEDDRNLYTCPEQPRHMSVAVNTLKYKLPYPTIFGGVCAISTEHFKLLNGFSNSFWGWGGEDDDMSNRIRYHHLFISRYTHTIARYTMLSHKKDKPSPNRYEILKQGLKRFDKDGLNSLKYTLLQRKFNLLYTWILVTFDPPPR